MSTRATPLSVAEREMSRWRERESKLREQLYEVGERIEQWERVYGELAAQAAEQREHTEPEEIEGVAS